MKYRCFTLLEMVIAMALMAFIAATIGMGTFSLNRTWNKVRTFSENNESRLKLSRIADSAFRNIIPFQWTDKDNRERLLFRAEPDALLFTCLHRVNRMEEGAIRFVRLKLEDEKIIAEYRNTPILPWSDEDHDITREVITENVRQLNFRYAGMNDEKLEWFEEWDEERDPNLPLAILMTVEWKDGSRLSWLRRTAGNSFYHSLGVRRKAVTK